MQAYVFIAVSADGFIARKNGDLDWLPGSDGSGPEDGEDYGYKEFFATIDTLVMGRHSFEKVLTFGEWPYKDKKVVVLSSKKDATPQHLKEYVQWLNCSPPELVKKLSSQGDSHIYVDGGKTIQGFLYHVLINKIILTRVPVLIGDGIPLFGPLAGDIKLKHIKTQDYPSGFVQTHYKPV
ncbi:MAG: dihydrofolate reductase [Magnetococcales bacterium]|nr:dihydrofolate reductase [Magnetococcales bacterium]